MKTVVLVLLVALFIIGFWMILGIFIPNAMYETLEQRGQFGDTFGAVNSLFTGIGFIAIAYTIALQIQAGKEQKEQELFNVYVKLVDDFRLDISTVKYGTAQGVLVWSALERYFTDNSIRTNQVYERVMPMMKLLNNANHQVILILKKLNAEKMSKQNKELIKAKLLLLYQSHIDAVNVTIANFEMKSSPNNWGLIKEACVRVINFVNAEVDTVIDI